MRSVAYLLLILAAPALGEPGHYEAFDFKNCLHWKIDNEMYTNAFSNAPERYLAALKVANRQPFSRHKPMSVAELDVMYRDHPDEMVVVYSAHAYDNNAKKNIEKYGVCNQRIGLACLPNQDFPLAGASYKQTRSKGALATSACVAACTGVPATLHYMGYENMEGEKNLERESAFRKFRKMCVRAP